MGQGVVTIVNMFVNSDYIWGQNINQLTNKLRNFKYNGLEYIKI